MYYIGLLPTIFAIQQNALILPLFRVGSGTGDDHRVDSIDGDTYGRLYEHGEEDTTTSSLLQENQQDRNHQFYIHPKRRDENEDDNHVDQIKILDSVHSGEEDLPDDEPKKPFFSLNEEDFSNIPSLDEYDKYTLPSFIESGKKLPDVLDLINESSIFKHMSVPSLLSQEILPKKKLMSKTKVSEETNEMNRKEKKLNNKASLEDRKENINYGSKTKKFQQFRENLVSSIHHINTICGVYIWLYVSLLFIAVIGAIMLFTSYNKKEEYLIPEHRCRVREVLLSHEYRQNV